MTATDTDDNGKSKGPKINIGSEGAKLLKFLDAVPLRYRQGPWSPVAYISLVSVGIFLLWTIPEAWASSEIDLDKLAQRSEPSWLIYYEIFFAVYGVSILSNALYVHGFWPIVTYTCTTWNLTWLRMLCSFIGRYNSAFAFFARAIRFPALVGATITCIIWWFLITPSVSYLMKQKEQKDLFRKFNFSFPLLNLHGAVFPIAVIEFLASGVPLHFFDLWVALFIVYLYVLWYLLVLDPLGYSIYIMFTPRTHLCVVAYCSVLGLYYANFAGWNSVLEYVKAAGSAA